MMESVITEEEHYVPTWEECKAYMQSVAPPCTEVVKAVELGGTWKILASFECAVPFHQTIPEFLESCRKLREERSQI